MLWKYLIDREDIKRTLTLCDPLADFFHTLAKTVMVAIVPSVIGAITSSAGAVDSVSNVLLDQKYRVTCLIEIHNWTNELLTQPVVRIAGGQVEIPPKDILPGKMEIMVARKRAYFITGSYGTVSWLIEGKNRRIVLMWFAPFNFVSHENWLAVGITAEGVTKHEKGKEWYQQMYKGISSSSLGFNKMKYKEDIETVIHEEDGIEISGTMSTSHQAKVIITVRPVNKRVLVLI